MPPASHSSPAAPRDGAAVQTAPGTGRIAALDGLRGVAALVVVVFHYLSMLHPGFVERFATEPLPWVTLSPLSILWNGFGAVLLFFVLSGFVIAAAAHRRAGELVANLAVRYLRLALPATASVLLALLWLSLVPTAAQDLAAARTPASEWLDFTVQGEIPSFLAGLYDGLVGIFVTGGSEINNVLWTMRTELVGSVALFVIYWVAWVARDSLLLRLAGIAALAVLSLTVLRSAYLCFALGALFYEAHRRGLLARLPGWTAVASLVTGLLLTCYTTGLGAQLVTVQLPWRLNPDNAFGLVPVLAATLLLYAALRLAGFAALMMTPVAQWLGRVSFALYLVHVPLLYTLVAWSVLHTALPGAVIAAGYVALTFALSHLFTLAIDEPSLKLLRGVRGWITQIVPRRAVSALR